MKIGKIEKGVELPPRQWSKYPLNEMEVGDSVLITFSLNDGVGIYQSVKATASRLRPHKKFTLRRVKGQGVRIWRMV